MQITIKVIDSRTGENLTGTNFTLESSCDVFNAKKCSVTRNGKAVDCSISSRNVATSETGKKYYLSFTSGDCPTVITFSDIADFSDYYATMSVSRATYGYAVTTRPDDGYSTGTTDYLIYFFDESFSADLTYECSPYKMSVDIVDSDDKTAVSGALMRIKGQFFDYTEVTQNGEPIDFELSEDSTEITFISGEYPTVFSRILAPAYSYYLSEISDFEGDEVGKTETLSLAPVYGEAKMMWDFQHSIPRVGAFRNAKNLEYARIPKTVRKIGRFAFAGTALSSVKISRDCEFSATSFPENCVIEFYESTSGENSALANEKEA